ncbi:MAG: LuxR C-terminal-related transcriptional regulator [Treponema sp.]|nr:LuxR C-terminal-related transcriptional regulator [Treponema sp.]
MPILQGNQFYLERPQIDRLLNSAVQSPVVTVVAGAGYGKTQAVYSFVRKYNVLTSWLQLSERDNIGERFWENFTATIGVISRESADRLAKIGFPESKRQFDRYMLIPRGDVIPNLKYVFVYDDFHLIQNKAVLRFMEKSITTSFPNITSILISRNEPSINLTVLRSKGLLAQITEDELRFSREEMIEYFALQDLRLSPRTASDIYSDTEGWAFAIHLAGLSLKNAPAADPADIAYVPHALQLNISKLIESEILSAVSPALQKYLIKLSLVDHLSPELIETIAGDKKIVDGIAQIGSLIQFDVYRNAVKIHPLFLDYLSGRQNELSVMEKQEVYAKAARWCSENNYKIDAVSYYEKSGDYASLIAAIQTLPLVVPSQIAVMLLEILDRAPAEMYEQIPLAYSVKVQIYLTLEMFDKAKAELETIIAKLRAAPPAPVIQRALMACYHNQGFLGFLTSTYTHDNSYVHYFEKAHEYFNLNNFELQPPVTVVNLSSYICRVSETEKGAMEKYIAALEMMVPHVSVSMNGCCYGMDDMAWAELFFFKGDLLKSEEFILKAIKKAREKKQYEIENRSLFYLVRINLARGNYDEIETIFKQFETQLDEGCYTNRFVYHDIVTGWFYAQIGQGDKLASWLKNDFEESDLNSLVYGQEILVRAKYNLAEKHYPAALAALEVRESKYSAGAFVMGKLEIKAHEAVCRYLLRDKEGAYQSLESAWELARSNEFVMPFTELGKDMRALVSAALKDNATAIPRAWLEEVRRNAQAYAKKLYRPAEKQRPAGIAPAAVTSLSRREMDVLLCLSRGLTREEIAGDLSISINTVKSVIRGAYNKLGAINRADAVRIATAAGIFENNE